MRTVILWWLSISNLRETKGYNLKLILSCSRCIIRQQLAQMHRSLSPSGYYGLDKDNFIGSTPQHNHWTESWCDFFIQQRLTPQIELFEENGYTCDHKDSLLQKVQQLLEKHHPPPSLLHGYIQPNFFICSDLWGGNASFIQSSIPVVFDPAVYYGDRETDIIMTQVGLNVLLDVVVWLFSEFLLSRI